MCQDAQLQQKLAKLSSAEDFFELLQVDYDPQVVRVNRLHILKRFHDYLARAGLEGSNDRHAYQAHLRQAYADFLTSSGIQEKVFKVFQQAQGTAFVPLTALRRPSSSSESV